jgi:hypothetical protein
MASLGSLVVSLAMDTAKFQADIGKAAQQMARLTASAAKMGAAVGTAAVAAAAGVAVLVKQSIDAADATSKLAQSVGTTTEEFTRLAYAGDMAGVSQEELGSSLAKLARQAADAAAGGKSANDVFSSMGISVKSADGSLKSTTQLLGDIADRFKAYGDTTTQTALAQDLFGKSGAKLIPLLNAGRDGLAEMAKEADALGITLSTGTAAAAEAFNDNLSRLNAVRQGLVNGIARELLPTLESLTANLYDTARSSGALDVSARAAATGVRLLLAAGANVAYVFGQVGNEVGGIAAQLAAVGRGDFSGASAIGKMMREDAERARKQIDGINASIWEPSSSAVEAKAPGLSAKLAAPLVLAAEKVARSRKAIVSDVEKAYASIEKRLAGLQFDVDTQGASDRIKGLIELTRQGATPDQAQRYLALVDAQAAFTASAEAAAAKQRDFSDTMAEGARVYEETRTPLERYAAEQARLQELMAAGAISADVYNRKILQSATAYQDAVTGAAEATANAGDLAKDLGMSFSSAFEDAIVGGRGLRDVLKGLEQDIVRIVTRRLVTEPLGDAITKMLQGGIKSATGGGGSGGGIGDIVSQLASFGSKLFGGQGSSAAPAAGAPAAPGGDWMAQLVQWGSTLFGGQAGGGWANPGRDYLVGEHGPEVLRMGNQGRGEVVPMEKARSQTITVNVQATPGMDRRTAMQQGEAIGRGISMAVGRNG